MADKKARRAKAHRREPTQKAQSAIEYLLTYSLAIFMLAIILAILYLFVFAPQTIVQNACIFSIGAYCQDLIFGSNAISSTVGVFLTNSQPYPIMAPSLQINISGVPVTSGICRPYLVLQGGAIICNITLSQKAISLGALVSGKLYLSAIPCPSGNTTNCQNAQKQTYIGNFNTHVSPLLQPIGITISLIVQNSSQLANGNRDELIATVKLLGTPIAGATVNFTANKTFVTITPTQTTTSSDGNAYSYASSLKIGSVKINATFANVSANTIINFTPPSYVTFQVDPRMSSSVCSAQNNNQNILTLDSNTYTCSQLPLKFPYQEGTRHTYSCIPSVGGPTGVRYICTSTSGGCLVTGTAGTLTVPPWNCTITMYYNTQYSLTEQTSPIGAGAVSPGSGWFDSGNVVSIGTTPNSGWFFKNWAGTGAVSYTGSLQTKTITMQGPITEQANYYSTTSTSTSTTSTTSTSTTTISCGTCYSITSFTSCPNPSCPVSFCYSCWSCGCNSYIADCPEIPSVKSTTCGYPYNCSTLVNKGPFKSWYVHWQCCSTAGSASLACGSSNHTCQSGSYLCSWCYEDGKWSPCH
jgi:hypothetical protein